MRAYEFIGAQNVVPDQAAPIVLNCHRRFGKSTLFLVMCVMRCLERPHHQAKYISNSFEQVQDIVIPLLDQLLETCPGELQPSRAGYQWTFRNPAWGLGKKAYSTLKLIGANYQRGNMARGQACDTAALDEVRDFKDLRYFIEHVLIHQFVDRDDPLLLMGSTPPASMDHDFTRPTDGYIPDAIRASRYLVVPGSENPDFSDRDAKIVESAIRGGRGSVAWRREVECELISDAEALITPEYEANAEVLSVTEHLRPEFFRPNIVIDTGFDPDFTAVLGYYLDFTKQLLVFEGEVVKPRMTTAEIATETRRLIAKLGYDKQHHVVRYYVDIEERGLNDLRRDWKIPAMPVQKYDARSALAHFRSKLQEGRVRVIQPKCPMLDYQLRHGIWDERKTDYARSDYYGHWDAGQAAVYATRMTNWNLNPVPQGQGITTRILAKQRLYTPYTGSDRIFRTLRGL